MSETRFTELSAIDSVLSDYVMQTIRRGAPELYKQALHQLNGRRLSLDDGLGQKLDDFFDAQDKLKDLAKSARLNAEFKDIMSKVQESDAKFIKKTNDHKDALIRLEQYAEQGLERTESNAQKVEQWLATNVNGYWSPSGVDAAVMALGPRGKNTLVWVPLEPPPPPQPKPTIWSPGQPLPEDATTAMLRHPSVTAAQIREWLKNKNK